MSPASAAKKLMSTQGYNLFVQIAIPCILGVISAGATLAFNHEMRLTVEEKTGWSRGEQHDYEKEINNKFHDTDVSIMRCLQEINLKLTRLEINGEK